MAIKRSEFKFEYVRFWAARILGIYFVVTFLLGGFIFGSVRALGMNIDSGAIGAFSLLSSLLGIIATAAIIGLAIDTKNGDSKRKRRRK